MQSAVAGSCYKHDEDFKTQLMNKAAAPFKKVDKDQDKKFLGRSMITPLFLPIASRLRSLT